uniref:Glycine-rich protein n=1 Tax=Oryza punctata TaxID=4537 RepID=A0A0E0K255_ORYPU
MDLDSYPFLPPPSSGSTRTSTTTTTTTERHPPPPPPPGPLPADSKSMSYFTCKPNSGLIVDRPVAGLGRTGRLLPHPQYSLTTHSVRFPKLQKQVYPRLVLVAASQKKLTPLCASSGKVNPEAENDPFMESLKKAMDDAKKPRPIQDLLKEQIAKLREQGSGGGGGNRNRRGGNGDSGGPEDESFKESLDELVQVILATVAFILVYIHIIRGEELYRLARDYTRYLVTGKRTARLKRAMQKWRNFSESFMQSEGSQEDQYERAATSKPTWWQQPQKFVHLMEELCRGNWRPHAQES